MQEPDPWYLTLINGDHLLNREAPAPELTEVSGGHQVDSRIADALEEMLSGARVAGLSPLICSSYRTWDKQEALYENKVRSCLSQGMDQAQAEQEAARWVARPGTSEHQAGLAVDIVDISYQLLDEAQEDTPVQQWLMAHCADYGFILRYPTDKSALTGVAYEPWHYRYVGAEAARAIMDRGLCLEEYLSAIKSAHRLQGGARVSYAGRGRIYTLISASVWGASLSRGATRRRRQSTCSGQRPM